MKLILCLSILAVMAQVSLGNFSKITPNLLKTMNIKNSTDILVLIDEIETVLASITSTYTITTTHEQKANSVYQALTDHAAITQKTTREFLATKKPENEIKSYWVNNMIWVKGADHDLIMTLASRPEVTEILEDEIITLDAQDVIEEEEYSTNQRNREWGIRKIRAVEAWLWTNGTGAIVGVIDTGARVTHTMIKHSYMGNNATKYAWFNPYRPSDATPNDLQGHGTQVTGTIAGNNGIGVAPGSKWISCKGLNDQGSGNLANLIACSQFMVCPHHHTGSSGRSDCSQAPHIVSNSWDSPGGNTAFDAAIRTWHAANIWPVFSAGNRGSTCSTIRSPADSVSDVISVAATTEVDTIASFSSRGPPMPSVGAPGQNVRSAGISSDTAFATKSGTSMAAPHVAGQVCNGTSDNDLPNNSFGWGRIDAAWAVAVTSE